MTAIAIVLLILAGTCTNPLIALALAAGGLLAAGLSRE
jgi:hypothetical protein